MPTSPREQINSLAAGAWPLCVKGAVTTLVVTGGLSPSGGRRFSKQPPAIPPSFCYAKIHLPLHKGGFGSPLVYARIFDTSSTAIRRFPFFSRRRAPFVGCADISPAHGGITSRRRLLPAASERVCLRVMPKKILRCAQNDRGNETTLPGTLVFAR